MNELISANLRYHARRYVATVVAVTIAVAFVAASLVFSGALGAGIRDQVAGRYTGAAAVVSETYDEETPSDLREAQRIVKDIPGVEETYLVTYQGFELMGAGPMDESWVSVGLVGGERLRPVTLTEGELPSETGQAVVTAQAAKRLNVSVGSSLTFRDGEGGHHELTVSGVSEVKRQSIDVQMYDLLVTPETLTVMGEWEASELLVALEGSSSPSLHSQEQLVTQLEAAFAGTSAENAQVETAYAVVDQALAEVNTDQAAISVVLLLFPVISAVVALIIVGTTFQVIFRQRERELALLRVIGATGKQVRRLMIVESVAVGLMGSLLGVIIGILGGAGIAVGASVVPTYAQALQSVSPLQIAVVLILGTLFTVLAGYRPALRASRVPPMRALSGGVQSVSQLSKAQKLIGLVSGVLTLGLGTTTAYFALKDPQVADKFSLFPLVLLLAVLTAAALITFLSAILPLITRAVGQIGKSEVFRLAGMNTARNPGRTAATGVAIFIGVTLISMVTLGAQSLRVTATTALDQSAPIDLIVTAPATGFTAADLSFMENIEGVEAAVPLEGTPATVKQVGTEGSADSAGSADGFLLVSEGISSVVRGTITLPEVGEVLIPSWIVPGATLMEDGSYENGSLSVPVEVCVADQCRELEGIPLDSLAGADRFVISPATAAQFSADFLPTQVWMKLTNPDDYPSVVGEIQEMGPELSIEGAVGMRSAIDTMVTILVMVVVALLAVSVLVALVGITNTLSLSVAERTQENGLLRALGMTKKQVRAMLSWEALLIGVSATVAGVGAGAFFGAVGFLSLPLGVSTPVVAVPWGQWALIVGVAIVAALTASIVPGRRASQVSPVEALAAQ